MIDFSNRINLVYLKRDLRLIDHGAIFYAEKAQLPYDLIFIFEPDFLKQAFFDIRHWQFQYWSLMDLNKQLKKFNREVNLLYGNPVEIFSAIVKKYKLDSVFSHQEVGADVTFARDRQLRHFFKKNNIVWIEVPFDGIVRGLKNRFEWRDNFERWLNSPAYSSIPTSEKKFKIQISGFDLPEDLLKRLENPPKDFQKAGETEAIKVLDSFLSHRHFMYLKNISKPFESFFSCSRLSAYLAYGNLSVRFVVKRTKELFNPKGSNRNLDAFLSRLFWRSHFIQKFETMPAHEFQTVNKAFEPWPFAVNLDLVECWAEGETGVDLVDAVMKCLKKTGWINFRMRALVVSFLCHCLQQPWQSGAAILARYFLDFEPGIHFTQMQMQAGVTGYNTIRIYNPEKQLFDHDPEKIFCSRWLSGRRPKPVVDWKKNLEQSKKFLWNIKKTDLAKAESEHLLKLLR
ncbi:MAG: deoxyribodipyrimidine photo-lyase [Deltaproteobacteria bacterium]|nr:deoxyribodipyrimidine photo-lyase [Deltaproteobacteria bacterium]